MQIHSYVFCELSAVLTDYGGNRETILAEIFKVVWKENFFIIS